MTDKLEAVLVDAIQKTQAGIGEAVDFAITQAPDVIQQLLLWKFIQSMAFFIPLFTFTMFCLIWFIRGIVKEKDFMGGDGYFLLFLGFCGSGALSCMALDWLKIWIAPKLYLVEYAAALLK